MSRNTGRLMFTGRNAPDELLTIFDVPAIVSGVFSFLHDLPAKEIGIELPWTRRAYLGRPSRAYRPTCDSDSGILLCLPKREGCAGGILDDGHPASIDNIKWRR
jgi:hypothetical protein